MNRNTVMKRSNFMQDTTKRIKDFLEPAPTGDLGNQNSFLTLLAVFPVLMILFAIGYGLYPALQGIGDNSSAVLTMKLWLIPPAAFALASTVPLLLLAPNHRVNAIIAFCIGAIALVLTARIVPETHAWIIGAIVCLHFVYALLRRDNRSYNLLVIATIAVLLVFSQKRFSMLVTVMSQPLDPDAGADTYGYMDIARYSGAYSTFHREPLFIWTIRAVGVLCGEISPLTMRLAGMLLSLFTLIVLLFTAWKAFGIIAGFVVGLLYASYPAFVFSSVRGLREDMVIGLVFLLIYGFRQCWNKPSQPRTAISLAIISSALLLLRMNSLTFIFSFWLLLVIKYAYTLKLRQLAAYLALWTIIIVAPSLPYAVYLISKYGDPMYPVTMAFAFYANAEFAGTKPEFTPSLDLSNEALGSGTADLGSKRKFLGKYFTLSQIATRTLAGAYNLFLGKFASFWQEFPDGLKPSVILVILQYIGMAIILLTSWWPALVLIILFHGSMYFLIEWGRIDWRLLTTAYGFFVWCIGIAVASVCHAVIQVGKQELRLLQSPPDEAVRASAKRPLVKRKRRRTSSSRSA